MASINPTKIAALGFDASFLSSRPLPTAPDGYYDWQVSNNPEDKRDGHSAATNVINRVEAFKQKGGFINPDPRVLAALADTLGNSQAIDDRKGALASGLDVLGRMDPYNPVAKNLKDGIIGTLYETIPHPPASYLGRAAWRQADGGGNNLENPDLGRAGTPYARSVQGQGGLPRHSLPDPGLIFDSILKRHDVKQHAGGMSSMIFAFASIVTHSLFRTDHKNMNVNLASSYLDLSPLYGDNQAAQDKVRDKSKGLGLLYPDTFNEERLLFAPPATSALLVLFSRNHNFIASRLVQINEWKKWSNPPPTDEAKRALQDEEIFQTAKLVNCGHFMSAIMGDYVAGFLGVSEGADLSLDPFNVIDTKTLHVTRGQGNHCSVEFNILYRWHATLSEDDQKWTENVFSRAFGGKPFNQLSMADVGAVASKFDAVTSEPSTRTFGGLTRGSDGKFADDDLANILQRATDSPAGAFRGQGTPEVLRIAEIIGIEQARKWGLCTMNEFRKFLGLKQFDDFEDWNPNPAIASAARQLYGHIDNLELYTGLQAEATMPLTDGFRFACGYTTTRGVLGDAIALVRGDRFSTSDCSPANYTTWGYHDCQRDMNNGGVGGQIPKLLTRHLPRHYPFNSVYSTFPFFTPTKMKSSLEKQGTAAKYTFTRPEVIPVPKVLNTFTGIKTAFSDPARFKVLYQKIGYGTPLVFDDVAQHDADKAMTMHALFPDKNSLDEYVQWYVETTAKHIKEKSWKYQGVSGTYVDITQVIGAVAVHLSTEKITGIPLKTKENPSGVCTEREMFDILASFFQDGFLKFDDGEHAFALHTTVERSGALLIPQIIKAILEVSPSTASTVFGSVAARAISFVWPPVKKPSYPFLSRLTASGRPLDEILGNIMGIAVGASVNHAQAAVQVINFYLEDAQDKERRHIVQLAGQNDTASTELLRGYTREGMRLRPQVSGLWRKAVVDAEIDQGPGLPNVQVKAGERIWNDFRTAHLNPAEFPNPTAVDPRRPTAAYHLNGMGFHYCPGTTVSVDSIAEIMRTIFKLKNLRRSAGPAGHLVGFSEYLRGTECQLYLTRTGEVTPWPGALHVVYDE